jgi:hypothetical protein
VTYYVLRLKLFPPPPSVIKEEIQHRIASQKEAVALTHEMSGKTAFFKSALHSALRSDDRDKEHKKSPMPSPRHGIAAALRPALAIAGQGDEKMGQGGKSASHLNLLNTSDLDPTSPDSSNVKRSPSPMSGRPTRHKSSKRVGGVTSLYKLTTTLMSVYGPTIQLLLDDFADLFEKGRNLILWRNTEGNIIAISMLSVISLFFIFCPPKYLLKLAWLAIGIEYFVIFGLSAKYPQYRRALQPWWWVLMGVPTDGQHAIYLIQHRKQKRNSGPAEILKPGVVEGLDSDVVSLAETITSLDGDNLSLSEKSRWRDRLLRDRKPKGGKVSLFESRV